MNEIKVINEQTVLGKNFRIYGDFENPLFLAKDVAEWIEHSKVSIMLESVDDDEKIKKICEVNNSYFLLMHSEKSYTITEIAKELGYNSAIEFNKLLHEDEIIFKQNGTWVPYSQYSKCGYFEIKQSILENELVVYNLRVTQKGREFLLSRYSNKKISK